MAANSAPNDWYPLPSGNVQDDENQRRIWQSLYYLRDQQNVGTGTRPVHEAGGLSGTAFFSGGFTMTTGPTGKTFYNMVIQNGKIVAVS